MGVSTRDKELYAQAALEVSNRVIDPGLWAKAFADSNGNEQQANAFYLKMRVLELSAQRDAAQRQLQQQARLQQQHAKQQLAAAERAKPAEEERRVREQRAWEDRLKETTRQYAVVYDQPLYVSALRFFYWIVGVVCVIVAISLLFSPDKDGLLWWFAVGGIAAFWIKRKLTAEHCIVTCPQCQTKSRVPSKTYMNFCCPSCSRYAEIQT